MRNKLIVILILAVSAAAGISSYIARSTLARALEEGPSPVTINAEAIPLSSEALRQQAVGPFRYVAGWALSSEHDDFGGWSGMVLGEAGKSIVAINDKGDWLTAQLALASPQPLSNATIRPFESGATMGLMDKFDFDAESLVRSGNGFLVGMEQDHRILVVDAIGGPSRRAAYDSQIDLSILSPNGGAEAMTKLEDDRLMVFAEHGLDVHGTLPAWIAGPTGVVHRRFAPPHNYSPTDAATLPNGDVLLLMRYFSALDGVSAKLLLLSAAEIASSDTLRGTELAHFAEPLSVDNMEALDIRVQPDGTIRLFMMSDDNFNPLQRTLLMVFDWKRKTASVSKAAPQ